jgi:hypothetical protein
MPKHPAKSTYTALLRDPHWQKKRLEVLVRDNFREERSRQLKIAREKANG